MTEDDKSEYREAFLLLQLLQNDPENRRLGSLNKHAIGNSKLFGKKVSVPNDLRKELCEAGYIREFDKKGRSAKYEITERGRGRLAETRQFPESLNKITGEMINELIVCVGEYHSQFDSLAVPAATNQVEETHSQESNAENHYDAVPSVTTTTAVSNDVIRSAVLEAIMELKRSEFHHRSYVPVYAVRRRIRERLGTQSASHETFDSIMKELWNQKKIRLVATTDLSLPEDQLQDALPGEGRTLFYVERA
ncbi:hypothetical protein KOR42_50240 [Thalassoglobus neptunius]|uniref:Uncharacterized protein n=1 Tax=Thalassoglobus neptunius TaxID=1938619 RepID=A0A5C5VPJ1_9PLAN|nr:hypothetical protein [Thalassoglobus neptunius]TWT40057.1 hypothetical protein KOR42_50240 [Thalassoglobus neptunius]